MVVADRGRGPAGGRGGEGGAAGRRRAADGARAGGEGRGARVDWGADDAVVVAQSRRCAGVGGAGPAGVAPGVSRRPVVAAALAAGAVSVEAATAVCVALAGLPAEVPAVQVGSVERLLVDVAVADGAAAVAKWATRITQQWAPDLLEEREAAARARRFLSVVTSRDGTVGVSGRFDQEGGALLTAVLGALAAPAPAVDGVPDPRDAGTRWADALLHVCQQATPGLPEVRGERPNVLLTISLETLRDGLADTTLPHGWPAGCRSGCRRGRGAPVRPAAGTRAAGWGRVARGWGGAQPRHGPEDLV